MSLIGRQTWESYTTCYFKTKNNFFSKDFGISLVVSSIISNAVILTIRSNAIVSLGMVGALSIVRFRAAIKRPIDLVFMFWAITNGIICAAGFYYIAIIAFLLISLVLLLIDEISSLPKNKMLVLNGKYPNNSIQLKAILDRCCHFWNIRTQNIHFETIDILVEIRGIKDERKMIEELKNTGDYTDISIIIQEGVAE